MEAISRVLSTFKFSGGHEHSVQTKRKEEKEHLHKSSYGSHIFEHFSQKNWAQSFIAAWEKRDPFLISSTGHVVLDLDKG